jgi:hypothetical protein
VPAIDLLEYLRRLAERYSIERVIRRGRLVLVREQREKGRTIVVQGWQHELRALTRKPGGETDAGNVPLGMSASHGLRLQVTAPPTRGRSAP